MKIWGRLTELARRFRYPASLPEELSEALGIPLSSEMSVGELVDRFRCPKQCPGRIRKFMNRREVEKAFCSALKKESFGREVLYSFYFSSGWLEFSLHFDNENRLRRMYVLHKDIPDDSGVEMPLAPERV